LDIATVGITKEVGPTSRHAGKMKVLLGRKEEDSLRKCSTRADMVA